MKATSLLWALILASCASNKEQLNPKTAPLLARLGNFRQCYLESDSFRENKKHNGKYILVYDIDQDGRVHNAKVTNSPFKDANLDACLVGILKQAKFGSEMAGTQIKQPMNFYPKEQ